MKKTILIFGLFLSGCASNVKNYEKLLEKWKGVDADQLVWSMGFPSSTYQTSDGRKIYLYANSSTGSLTMMMPSFNMASTTYDVRSCQTYFLIDKTNLVTEWHWQGNDCKIPDPDKKQTPLVYPTSGWSNKNPFTK